MAETATGGGGGSPVYKLTCLLGPNHAVVPDFAVYFRLVALWPGRDQPATRVVGLKPQIWSQHWIPSTNQYPISMVTR